MDVSFLGPNSAQADQYFLLMEQAQSHNDRDHIIVITRNDDSSSTSSSDEQHPGVDLSQLEDSESSSRRTSPRLPPSSSNRLSSRNAAFTRRGDGYGRRRRSPLNSGLWISVELLVTVGQIVASIVVLSLSRDENPQAPLFTWIVGYASGCVATLPLLYWRFRNRNQGTEESIQSHGSSQISFPESTPYTAISVTQTPDEENHHATRSNQLRGTPSTR